MRRVLQKLLDGFYNLRSLFVARLTYCSLRLYGIEVEFKDIQAASYATGSHEDLRLDRATDLSALLGLAKECLTGAQDRRLAITDKCKTLLTVSSLLLGLFGLFLPRVFLVDISWKGSLFLLSILALFNAVTLLLVFFDVGKETEVSLDQNEVNLDSDNLKKNYINLNLRCRTDLDNRTDYLVDVYRSARFFFLSAFAGVLILLLANFDRASDTKQAEHLIRQLRSDPVLIELLRGPKGEQGEPGERERVVLDDVINRLLTDPRLKNALEALEKEGQGTQEGKETARK